MHIGGKGSSPDPLAFLESAPELQSGSSAVGERDGCELDGQACVVDIRRNVVLSAFPLAEGPLPLLVLL